VPLRGRERKKLSIKRQRHRTALNRAASLAFPSRAFHLHKSLKEIGPIVIEDFKLYRTEFFQTSLILIYLFAIFSVSLRRVSEWILSVWGNR
jgi:hypothetical protein